MPKYCKVMFGTTSGAKSDFKYNINEVTIAKTWNKEGKTPEEMGGFNYTTEDSLIRWLHRGDTMYDVTIPDDAETVKLEGATTVYRANKIIISNPRPVDDNLALHLYQISNIPEKSYYKALAAVSVMNYKNTALAILKDKVNKDNIDTVLDEWHNFIFHGGNNDRQGISLVEEIEGYLNEIKSDLLISRFIDKEPYHKVITKDKIINLTGESGSGKSYYTKSLDDNYLIIDTDILFSDKPCNETITNLRNMFITKYGKLPNLIEEFDTCYQDILNYFKDVDKYLVIDSAQYRNIKDLSLLKGEIIILRTSANTCYERCISRYMTKPSINKDELEKYKERKKAIFTWYHSVNKLLERIDNL